MRDGQEILVHSIFGVYAVGEAQSEKVISSEEQLIRLSKPGDQYVLKACVGAGGGRQLAIQKLQVHIHAAEEKEDLGLDPREYTIDVTPSEAEMRQGSLQRMLQSMLGQGGPGAAFQSMMPQ